MSDEKNDNKQNDTPALTNADLAFLKAVGISTTAETLESEKLKELILPLLPEPPQKS